MRETLEALRLWVDSELQRLISHPWADVQPLVSASLDESGVDWSFFARPEADRLLGRREDLRTPQPWLVARIGALLEFAERDPASAPMISVLARIEWRDCVNAPLRLERHTRRPGQSKSTQQRRENQGEWRRFVDQHPKLSAAAVRQMIQTMPSPRRARVSLNTLPSVRQIQRYRQTAQHARSTNSRQ